MDKRIKSVPEVLSLLGEHMEALRPDNKPTQEKILAAKTFSSIVDSYLATILACMEYYKTIDEVPDFDFMQVQERKPKTISATNRQ